MGVGPGARGAIDNDDAADNARRAVDHEVGAALVDTTQTLVCILDREGRIVRFNPACERVTGWTSEEVVGRDARETVIPPEDHAAFIAMIRGMVATGAPNPQQGQWVTRDGYRRVIAWANRPLRDEQGAVRYVVTSGLDITERESAASELWALQAELRDRLEDLSRLAAEQAALRRVATLVAREPPAKDVFLLVTEEASRLLGAESGLLLSYDENHASATVVGHYTELATPAFALGTTLPVEGDTLSSTVPRSGRTGRLDSYAGLTGEIARRAREGQYRSVVAAPVVVAGRVWGLLVAATQRDEPLASNAEQRLESFAELVALALAGAEARRELAASRTRIVEAGDAARRRLERDLHDGAQQRLVAVSLQMRLARARVDKDPTAAAEILDEAGEQLAQGLEQLRELARGIHPALLTDRGLKAALAALSSRAPFPVGLDVVDERFAQPVEVAVYYLVSEALTNAAKYADPTGVSVTVQRTDDGLAAEIADDGSGGANPDGGTGLRGLGDRVEALGGHLRIDSPPGAGTRIRAELPLR
jgi:PAS domain S-box-containing protein